MTNFDEHLPDDVRDIAERLVDARVTLSPFEFDDLRARVQRRVSRPSRGRRLSGLRKSSIAGALAAALMLSSGAGAVIASTSIGGGSQTFQALSFRDNRDSSYCQYHG